MFKNIFILIIIKGNLFYLGSLGMDHKDEGTHSNKCKLGHEGIIRNMKEYSQEGIESAYQSNILFRFHNSSASFSNSCK